MGLQSHISQYEVPGLLVAEEIVWRVLGHEQGTKAASSHLPSPLPPPSVSYTRESSPVVHLQERGYPIQLCEPSVHLTMPVCAVMQMGMFSGCGQAPAHPLQQQPSTP